MFCERERTFIACGSIVVNGFDSFFDLIFFMVIGKYVYFVCFERLVQMRFGYGRTFGVSHAILLLLVKI